MDVGHGDRRRSLQGKNSRAFRAVLLISTHSKTIAIPGQRCSTSIPLRTVMLSHRFASLETANMFVTCRKSHQTERPDISLVPERVERISSVGSANMPVPIPRRPEMLVRRARISEALNAAASINITEVLRSLQADVSGSQTAEAQDTEGVQTLQVKALRDRPTSGISGYSRISAA